MVCRFFTPSDRKRETDEGIMICTASVEAFLIFLGALASAVAYCVTKQCIQRKPYIVHHMGTYQACVDGFGNVNL